VDFAAAQWEGFMFVNRVSELELLEKRYASGKAEFFVL